MIKLYHYSNKDFTGYIKPGFFGENSFTRNSKDLSEIKRVYFYLNKSGREYYFSGCQFLYIAKISEARLYDLNIDPLNLAGRVRDIFKTVKSRGYSGLIGNNGYSCGVLFYPIKINKRLTLTR
jgi:hypothetical protein